MWIHLLVQPLAVHELHGQETNAFLVLDRMQCDDVGMIEGGHGARLVLEARVRLAVRRLVGGQHLERDVTAESAVARPVHLSHAARAQRGDDLVGSEARASGERHRANLP